jgi:hypothetical protein
MIAQVSLSLFRMLYQSWQTRMFQTFGCGG